MFHPPPCAEEEEESQSLVVATGGQAPVFRCSLGSFACMP